MKRKAEERKQKINKNTKCKDVLMMSMSETAFAEGTNVSQNTQGSS